MRYSVVRASASFGSLSGRARPALPLAPTRCETPSRGTRPPSLGRLRNAVWGYWKKYGRHDLPWRKTKDPYKILVSEVMLQQTQVSRVEGKYREFLESFPTLRALAKTPLQGVLKVWSGLGYNRRAKFLHDSAKEIMRKYNGKFPTFYSELIELPGIGDYTAKAVRVFAFNQPEVLIETNIRTVFFHHFSKIWTRRVHISDKEVGELARKAAESQNPREWHWALMDYGAHLKSSGVRINARSKHYTKQSKFEGSLRQVRGAILRAITQNKSVKEIKKLHKDNYEQAFASLVHDGLLMR